MADESFTCPFESIAPGRNPAYISECEYHTPGTKCEHYRDVLNERARRTKKNSFFGRLFG